MLRFLFVCLLLQVSICDIRTLKIPDRLNLTILVLGLIRQLTAQEPAWETAAGGLLAVALPMYLLAVAFPGSIGGGDIKFTAAAGVFLGAASVLQGAATGMLVAGVYGAGLLLRHKKTARQTFALGPFLAAGFLFVIITG